MTAENDYRTARPIDDDEAGPEGQGLVAPAGTSLRDAATVAETPQRKLSGRRARITLEGPDGEPLEPVEVRIDNRDYLRWDKTAPRQGWAKKDQQIPPFIMATFLSWSAMQRQGLTDLTWTQFEAACIECHNVEEDDTDAAGPTQ